MFFVCMHRLGIYCGSSTLKCWSCLPPPGASTGVRASGTAARTSSKRGIGTEVGGGSTQAGGAHRGRNTTEGPTQTAGVWSCDVYGCCKADESVL